ncbi:MAG: toxin-antitoxin system YwqK family antitoxin [Chitinophagales bacterium]
MKNLVRKVITPALLLSSMNFFQTANAASAVAADPSNGKYGYSFGKPNKAAAEAEAKSKCGGAAVIIASTEEDGFGAVLRSHDIFRMPGEKVTVDAIVGQKDPVGARKVDTETCKDCQFVAIWNDNAKTAKGADLRSGSGSGDIPTEITWRFFNEKVSGWEEYERCVKCPLVSKESPFREICPHGFYYEYNKETNNHQQRYVKGAGFDCKRAERWQEFSHVDFKLEKESYWKDDLQTKFARTFYTETGKIADYTEFENGKEDGIHMAFNRNGNIMEYGFYKNGKKTGTWKVYDPTTYLLSMENSYVEGEKSGPWIDYHPNGKKSQEITYSGSNRNGLQTKWNKDGMKTFETNFVNDKEDGIHKEYNNSVLVMEQGYSNGQKNGVYKKYNSTTKKPIIDAAYKDGEKDGDWKEFDPNSGKPTVQSTYTNGKLEGEYKEWDDKGTLIIDGHYANGKKDGEWTVIRRGETLHESYVNGVKVN